MATDLPDRAAHLLIKQLLHFDEIAQHYIPKTTNPIQRSADQAKPKLNLLVFSKRRDFQKLVQQRDFAAYTHPSLDETLLVIGPDNGQYDVQSNAFHEYTHFLLRNQPRSFPMWYEEGIASVLEATKLRFNSGTARITLDSRFEPLRNWPEKRLELDELINTHSILERNGNFKSAFYKASAQWVHLFLFGHESGISDFRSGLQRHLQHRNLPLEQALDTPLDGLRQAHRRYFRMTKLPNASHKFEVKDIPVESRAMQALETWEWQARAAESINPRKTAALREKILAADPSDLNAQLKLIDAIARIDFNQAKAMFDALPTSAKQQPRALITAANMVTQDCQLDRTLTCLPQWQQAAAQLRIALEHLPNDQEAIFLLGLTELYTGNPGRAVNYLRVAHARAPWSPVLNLHLGECLRLLGHSQAVTYLLNAKHWAFHPGIRRLATLALKLEVSQLEAADA